MHSKSRGNRLAWSPVLAGRGERASGHWRHWVMSSGRRFGPRSRWRAWRCRSCYRHPLNVHIWRFIAYSSTGTFLTSFQWAVGRPPRGKMLKTAMSWQLKAIWLLFDDRRTLTFRTVCGDSVYINLIVVCRILAWARSPTYDARIEAGVKAAVTAPARGNGAAFTSCPVGELAPCRRSYEGEGI